MSLGPAGKKSYMLAKIKDFFAISKSANAQASPVSDIMVVALDHDDNVLDDDITGPDGSFQLSVSGGDVTLVFATPDFEVSTTIFVPADGTVNIIVVLQPGQVEEVKVDFNGDGGNGDEDFVCTDVVGAITVDNLVVPDGQTCTLNGTRVQGNVFVLTDATLNAGGVDVEGNIQAEGADAVNVGPGSVVGGNIQIVQGGSAHIEQVVIDADLQLFQNSGPLSAIENTIGGNMQVFENTGGVTILNNNIEENLQCKENNPPPTGGGNVAGDKEDQCAGL
jgi:hypothetical protein